MKVLLNSVTLLIIVLFVTACGSSNENAIENIYDEQMYMEQDDEREYVITFKDDGRADVAWYGREDTPESISYEIVDEVEVDGYDEPKEVIQFDNFPNHTYNLSNSNDNQFIIDNDEDNNIIFRAFNDNEEKGIVLNKDYISETTEGNEERDVFLIEADE